MLFIAYFITLVDFFGSRISAWFIFMITISLVNVSFWTCTFCDFIEFSFQVYLKLTGFLYAEENLELYMLILESRKKILTQKPHLCLKKLGHVEWYSAEKNEVELLLISRALSYAAFFFLAPCFANSSLLGLAELQHYLFYSGMPMNSFCIFVSLLTGLETLAGEIIGITLFVSPDLGITALLIRNVWKPVTFYSCFERSFRWEGEWGPCLSIFAKVKLLLIF